MNGRASLQCPFDKDPDDEQRHPQNPRPQQKKPLQPPKYGPPPTTRTHHFHDESPLSQRRGIAALPRGNNGRDQSAVHALPPKSHDGPRGRRGLTSQQCRRRHTVPTCRVPQDTLGAFAPSLCFRRASWRGDKSPDSSRGLTIPQEFASSELCLHWANRSVGCVLLDLARNRCLARHALQAEYGDQPMAACACRRIPDAVAAAR
jgi:hypothetical protein